MSQIAFNGSKEAGTDPHTLLAKVAELSRDDAKTAGFRIQYGGGKTACTMGLRAAHVDWPMETCESKALLMLQAKKGTKDKGHWTGGTDSEAHNYMEDFARTTDARLPVSNRMIPSSINLRYDSKREFHTSRINFCIQATGQDILHLTHVAVAYLASRFSIPYRFCLDRHDELWYHVPEDYVRDFARIMNLAHCLAWARVTEALGFHDLPSVLLGFSAINVDGCLRKEVDLPTTTVSGGIAMEPGYTLAPGDLL